MENWIKKEVIIDFSVPSSVQYLIDLCEKANSEEDYAYFNYVEALDYTCKELFATGRMTRKQWDIASMNCLCQRITAMRRQIHYHLHEFVNSFPSSCVVQPSISGSISIFLTYCASPNRLCAL